jgi:hypothetical protein
MRGILIGSHSPPLVTFSSTSVFDEHAQWDRGSGSDDGKSDSDDDIFTVKYTTTGPAAPTTDGIDEAPTEESPLPAGAGDVEVDDNIDDENLDADHDDDVIIQ